MKQLLIDQVHTAVILSYSCKRLAHGTTFCLVPAITLTPSLRVPAIPLSRNIEIVLTIYSTTYRKLNIFHQDFNLNLFTFELVTSKVVRISVFQ